MARKSKKVIKDLVLPDFSRYFLLFTVTVSVVLLFWVVSPFFTVLVFAALIAIIFSPLNEWLAKIFKGYRTFAAFLSTLIVLILFLVPLVLFVMFIAKEAVDTYPAFEAKIAEIDFRAIDLNKLETLPVVGEQLNRYVDKYELDTLLERSNIDIFASIQEIFQGVSTFIVNQSTLLVKSLSDTIISGFILVMSLFFLFKDGQKLRDYLKVLSPLPKQYEDAIEKKLKETTYGMVVGGFGTSILQGFLGGLGFAIAGLEHAIFYGTIMTFASLIPYIGSSIIWAPVALFMLIQGPFWGGVFLSIWGLFLISNIDNIVRPYLIGATARMHPLATFFVVLGGLFVFGLKGIVYGPLILSFALSVLYIYRLEYKEVLDH